MTPPRQSPRSSSGASWPPPRLGSCAIPPISRVTSVSTRSWSRRGDGRATLAQRSMRPIGTSEISRRAPQPSGGAQFFEEPVHLIAQAAGDRAKLLGDRFYRGRIAARACSIVAELAHRARRLGGAFCSDLGAARDLTRGCTLL